MHSEENTNALVWSLLSSPGAPLPLSAPTILRECKCHLFLEVSLVPPPPPSRLHLSQWPQLSAKLMLLPEISGYQTLSESPRGLLQPAYWSPLPVSDLVGLGWGTRICISNKFPGMMVLLVQVHTLRSPF